MTVDSAAARFTAIFDTIREFRLSNMMFEDGEGFYLLVDAMTAEGRCIDDGEEQMRDLAAEIISALDTLAAPASAAEPVATITFTRAMGIYGKAYDLPGPHRAYTYEHQPDNQAAYRLGKIAAMPPEGGDHIDYGLYLLKAMQESGFGVFETEPLAIDT